MRKPGVLFLLTLAACCWLSSGFPHAARIKALIIDGQNNHQWWIATSVLRAILENSGRFSVEVITSPKSGEDLSGFRPDFGAYDIVVSNYNGDPWPEITKKAFEAYVRSGHGFVVYHAADNAFPEWPEYNEMIGLGGWGDRNESHGPYLRWRNGGPVQDQTPGKGGSHGKRHSYLIDNRDPDHPIMKGLPARWLHSTDELYDRLRGPARNLHVLATAYSDPATGGSGEHEPVLLTIKYGSGRVFHTVLGDNLRPLYDLGFQTTLVRGAEWAATGEVTVPVPAYPLSERKVVTRDPFTPYLEDGIGWSALFNGKDLTGWEQVNGEAKFRVEPEAGELIGTTATGSPNSFLSTIDEYNDFELRFEVKLDNPELNSGVQIRSHQYESAVQVTIDGRTQRHPAGRVYGYQVEIEAAQDAGLQDTKYGDAGFIYDEARRGWLSTEQQRNDPLKRAAFHNGAWNQYHIRCSGGHIETWLNGLRIADLEDNQTASGKIMLQVHSIPTTEGPWSVRWRNILIRSLLD